MLCFKILKSYLNFIFSNVSNFVHSEIQIIYIYENFFIQNKYLLEFMFVSDPCRSTAIDQIQLIFVNNTIVANFCQQHVADLRSPTNERRKSI